VKPELHDSDVERQLTRRAEGEWRPERVLAAVRGATPGARQEGPITRWAGLVGAAVVVALLAVLAVALPALAPGPAATPGPTDARRSPEPQSMSCGGVYQLIDETELVVSCTGAERVAERDGGVVVTGADGVSLTVQTEWLGSSCADMVIIGLARGADAYSLTISEAGGPPDCEGVAVGRALSLVLTEPIPGELVASMESSLTPMTPPPSPTPTDGIIEPESIGCDSAPAANGERPALNVTVHDATGQVLDCEAFNGSSEPWGEWLAQPVVANHGGNPLQLVVTFTTSLCNSNADITLWLDRGEPNLLIYLPDEFDACRLLLITHRVVIQLREPIDGDRATVTLRSANDPPDAPTPMLPAEPAEPIEATATARDGDGGTFVLTLRADRAEYAADEPIDVKTGMAYEGPADGPLNLVGSGSGLVVHFIEQLDGDLAMGGFRTGDCRPYDFPTDAPSVVPFQKGAGWSVDDPNADFYRSWVEDPVLRLPRGKWRIVADGEFYVGECGGRLVRFQVELTITVR
jgi:hypothetical protein